MHKTVAEMLFFQHRIELDGDVIKVNVLIEQKTYQDLVRIFRENHCVATELVPRNNNTTINLYSCFRLLRIIYF